MGRGAHSTIACERLRAGTRRPARFARVSRMCILPVARHDRGAAVRFGVHIPTCIEGMMYPVPFATPADILPTALLCEELGFDSVWGNDHMTTQRYVQREFPDPPNFF